MSVETVHGVMVQYKRIKQGESLKEKGESKKSVERREVSVETLYLASWFNINELNKEKVKGA